MKIIITELGSRGSYLGSWQPSRFSHVRSQLERLINWLGGIDTHTFSVAEKLIARNLPDGIKIPEASAEQLGRATKLAMESHHEQAEEIVSFVFSSLKAQDGEKGEAVTRSMISVMSAKSVPEFVRIAVRARPSLALTVANTAVMLVPEKAEQISSAVESVVTTVSY